MIRVYNFILTIGLMFATIIEYKVQASDVAGDYNTGKQSINFDPGLKTQLL